MMNSQGEILHSSKQLATTFVGERDRDGQVSDISSASSMIKSIFVRYVTACAKKQKFSTKIIFGRTPRYFYTRANLAPETNLTKDYVLLLIYIINDLCKAIHSKFEGPK